LSLTYDRDNQNDNALHSYEMAANAGNAYARERLEFLKGWLAKQQAMKGVTQ
jgi:hypothetical protein